MLLTISDLAKRYRVSKASIMNYVKQRKLPAGFHIGRNHRWTLSEIEAWENERIASESVKAHE